VITPENLKFKHILIDKAVRSSTSYMERARAICARWPEADIVWVDSYWKNPVQLAMTPEEWVKNKRDYLVLGIKRTHDIVDSGRSTDFIASSHSTGCLSACTYCYHARRTIQNGQGSNLLTVHLNVQDVWDSIVRHHARQGRKVSNQCDSKYWTYDIGNVNDVSIDAMISDNPMYLISQAASMQGPKLSFATKTVHEEPFLSLDPKGMTRIRYSLMPQSISTAVDIRTSDIESRIRSANTLVAAGYEVHFNFSPVIIYPGFGQHWLELFHMIDDICNDEVKQQLACEIIFLTHSSELHDVNVTWHPKGEDYLWQPDIQQTKYNKPDVICYKYDIKKRKVEAFQQLLAATCPYIKVRYAF